MSSMLILSIIGVNIFKYFIYLFINFREKKNKPTIIEAYSVI